MGTLSRSAKRPPRNPSTPDTQTTWGERLSRTAELVTILGFIIVLPSVVVAAVLTIDTSFEVTVTDVQGIGERCITEELLTLRIDALSDPPPLVGLGRAISSKFGNPIAIVEQSSRADVLVARSRPIDRVTMRLPAPGMFHYVISGYANVVSKTGDETTIHEFRDSKMAIRERADYFLLSHVKCDVASDPKVLYPIDLSLLN